MDIYIFGTENKGDDLAIKVGKELAKKTKHRLIFSQEPTELLDSSEAVIIDVVKGLKRVSVIKPDMLKERRLSTLHDFDLGFFLKLTDQTGLTGKIKIIGIPLQGNVAKLTEQVKKLL